MYKTEIATIEAQVSACQKSFAARTIKRVFFVACGGSLATISYGAYILGQQTGKVDVVIQNAAEFAAQVPLTLDAHSLVVLNSQSGGTAETVAAAKIAKEKGALTVAFTTAPNSPIETAAEHTIYYYDNPLAPYPTRLTIFPDVCQMAFALVDVLEGRRLLADFTQALEDMEDVFDTNLALYKPAAKAFANAATDEKVIYTVAAGIDYPVAYVATTCLIMESLWKHSSALHAGEFFHGSFEAVDEQVMVLAFLGLGAIRTVEERAVKFLQRITPKLHVIDQMGLDLSKVPDSMKPYIAPLVANRIAADYMDEVSYRMGHPISSRRYMGVQKY